MTAQRPGPWDPASPPHNYYNLNPEDDISYRYSYDTGAWDLMISFSRYCR